MLFPPLLIGAGFVGCILCALLDWPPQGLLITSGAPATYVILIYVRRVYRNASFDITADGVSGNCNFMGKSEHEVLFCNVKDIKLKISWLQKHYGLGDIVLCTQSSISGQGGTGLTLSDIERPQQVYDFLKERIREGRTLREFSLRN